MPVDAGHALSLARRPMFQAGFGRNVLGGLRQLPVAQRAQQVARQNHALPAPLGQPLSLKHQKPIHKEKHTTYDTLPLKIDFTPADMWRYESKIEVMTYFELKDYIVREKLKGSNMIEFFEVEQYRRSSFPFATFILTIIGVAISSRKVRGGVGIQIALGLFLSCILHYAHVHFYYHCNNRICITFTSSLDT